LLRLDTGVVIWAGPSLDLTDEVVKILDDAMAGGRSSRRLRTVSCGSNPARGIIGRRSHMDMVRLAEVAARHRVTLLLQHGSTVSGRVHAHSDLDIAALFEASDVSLADVAGLSADLQGLNPGERWMSPS